MALALASAAPAAADVILPGTPVVPIRIDAAQARRMEQAARDAMPAIFDLSRAGRPAYLDDAYRAAGAKGIVAIERIVAVRVIGYRAFVLVVAERYQSPQTIGEAYVYIQCRFDDDGRVTGIDMDI
ncbi:MAG: hypothetical protein PGN09_03560 [Sphingomonas fennica]